MFKRQLITIITLMFLLIPVNAELIKYRAIPFDNIQNKEGVKEELRKLEELSEYLIESDKPTDILEIQSWQDVDNNEDRFLNLANSLNEREKDKLYNAFFTGPIARVLMPNYGIINSYFQFTYEPIHLQAQLKEGVDINKPKNLLIEFFRYLNTVKEEDLTVEDRNYISEFFKVVSVESSIKKLSLENVTRLLRGDTAINPLGDWHVNEDNADPEVMNYRNSIFEQFQFKQKEMKDKKYKLEGKDKELPIVLYPVAFISSLGDKFKGKSVSETVTITDTAYFRDYVTPTKLGSFISKGVQASATFIPYETNVTNHKAYYPYIDKENDKEFYERLDKEGAYRKVLMWDSKAGRVEANEVSLPIYQNFTALTLRDLIDNRDNIVVYLDENFYNKKYIGDNTAKNFDDIYLKNKEYRLYNSPKLTDIFSKILTPDTNTNLKDVEGYSVFSAVDLVRELTTTELLRTKINDILRKQSPIFISSKQLKDISDDNILISSYYNYLLLDNLSEFKLKDSIIEWDYNRPLYMDIFGNIITENNIVVIPAMANTTLRQADIKSPPISAGFWYYYKTHPIKDVQIEGFTETGKPQVFLTKAGKFNPSELDTTKYYYFKKLYRFSSSLLKTNYIDTDKYFYLITEVLRGCPLDYLVLSEELSNKSLNFNIISILMGSITDTITEIKNLVKANIGIMSIDFINYTFIAKLFGALFIPMLFILGILYLIVRSIEIWLKQNAFINVAISSLFTILLVGVYIFILPSLHMATQTIYNNMIISNDLSRISSSEYYKWTTNREVQNTRIVPPLHYSKYIIPVHYFSNPFSTDTHIKINKTNNLGYVDVFKLYDSVQLYYLTDINKIGIYVDEWSDDLKYLSYTNPYYFFLNEFVLDINKYLQSEKADVIGITSMSRSKEVLFKGIVYKWLYKDIHTDDVGLGYKVLQELYPPYFPISPGDKTVPDEVESIFGYHNSVFYKKMNENKMKLIDKEFKKYLLTNQDLFKRLPDNIVMKQCALQLGFIHNKVNDIRVSDKILVGKMNSNAFFKYMLFNDQIGLFSSIGRDISNQQWYDSILYFIIYIGLIISFFGFDMLLYFLYFIIFLPIFHFSNKINITTMERNKGEIIIAFTSVLTGIGVITTVNIFHLVYIKLYVLFNSMIWKFVLTILILMIQAMILSVLIRFFREQTNYFEILRDSIYKTINNIQRRFTERQALPSTYREDIEREEREEESKFEELRRKVKRVLLRK